MTFEDVLKLGPTNDQLNDILRKEYTEAIKVAESFEVIPFTPANNINWDGLKNNMNVIPFYNDQCDAAFLGHELNHK